MRWVCLVAAFAGACGDNGKLSPDALVQRDARTADAPPPDGNPLEPDTLAGTGLCLDASCSQTSSDARQYSPSFALWADTSTKRRWIYLPPGTKIDTSDMDHWVFPMGTKIWKEFTRGGTRVETRYIAKVGPTDTFADWFYVSYAWNATQDATTAVPLGVTNALGTGADIPSRTQCRGCHERLKPSRVLGFGAIQLDHAAGPGEIALDDLIAANTLTAPPAAGSPHFPLPGTATEQAALGYFHANCGHCHNPSSDVFTSGGIPMNLRLVVGSLATPQATPTYATTIGVAAQMQVDGLTQLVVARDAAHSIVVDRFESPNSALHMPALCTAVTDPTGDATIRAWIGALN
jgi:hypothetical protein